MPIAALLGRIAVLLRSVSPAVAKRLIVWVANATRQKFTTIDDIYRYFVDNPSAILLLLEGMVVFDIGADIAREAMNESEDGRKLLQGLDAQKKVPKIRGPGSLLSPDQTADFLRAQARGVHGAVLLRAFGSWENAEAVQVALQTLTPEDFQFLREFGTGSAR